MAGGGGEIQVVPNELVSAGKATQSAANTVSQAHGTFTSGVVGEAGCGPEALGAFTAMQQAWTGQVGYLGTCVGGLAAALGYASKAYPENDDSQMVIVWTTE